ncbi:hypothetical protein H3Z85_07715 [Chryseobacterium indologenes]|uniref:hypothetical protein n=1 Tax=Chryseobacterium indologenes TaxID=253 RepID=UPI0004B9EBA9|nr:hypothetical protein [Chryseobacterium indologenes]MBF6646655.1 hypothetical protein [Chryseobacterium indologenes]MBU3047868.1 hypothetical protein [Chryseobacterium indologenes]MEB4760504.1 hypothetical protein [Chryseobacterium indologenes]QIX80875.1 hypothetical protein FOB56_06325 [Chryseobacterium indologenes]QPQ53231.1 hypothetical protein H3Z85_07715 [Chryseobacterium indologenes]
MKKSNIQKRTLSKTELKEINGSARPPLCLRGFCEHPVTGELVPGLIGRDGFCC